MTAIYRGIILLITVVHLTRDIIQSGRAARAKVIAVKSKATIDV